MNTHLVPNRPLTAVWRWGGVLSFCLILGVSGCKQEPAGPKESYQSRLDESLKKAPIEEVAKVYRDKSGQVVELLFYNKPISPQLAEQFGKFPTAQQVSLQECRSISPAVFKSLSQLPELTTLHILLTPVTDADLAELAAVKSLRQLKIANGDITGATLDRLADLPLEELDLTGDRIDTAGANQAGSIAALKILRLHSSSVKVGELTGLADHANLTELDVSGCDAGGPAWLDVVTSLPKLTVLRCDASEVDDAALARLASIATLESLDLTGSQVTDDGLAVITKMPALASLTLSDCQKLTDACLAHVAQVATLSHLDLQESTITPPGLQALHTMKQLKRLDLHQGQMQGGGDALSMLRAALPDCEVVVTEDLTL